MSDSPANAKPVLWMITGTPSETSTDGSKGGYWDSDEETSEKAPLPVDKLQGNLHQFLIVVENLFINAEQRVQKTQQTSETPQKPSIELDQIELSAAITAEGEVGFWGLAKGKVGGLTEIKLTFKRKES